MRNLINLVIAVLMTSVASAQKADLPYAKGNVDDFVNTNRSVETPCVVLYNFHLASG